MGNPGESEWTFLNTLKLVSRLRFIVNGISVAAIYPSTVFFELARQKGNIPNDFSWMDKFDEIPTELIDLPVFIDPFVPTFLPPRGIREILVKHKKEIKKLIRRKVVIKLVHDYGGRYLLNWRFWHNSLRYLPTRSFLHRMLNVVTNYLPDKWHAR